MNVTYKTIRVSSGYPPVHFKRLKASLRRMERKWGRVAVVTHLAPNRYDIGIEQQKENTSG